MAVTQYRSKRKVSGGRYRSFKKKRKVNLGNIARHPRIEERKAKSLRTRSGKSKRVLLSADFANVYDPSEKKYSKVKMKAVAENPANKNLVRRNVLTKGAIIDTEKGRAKITNRPGQEGSVNAVLLK